MSKLISTVAAVVAISLASAACAPNFDGKLPCSSDAQCPTGFYCSTEGKCQTGSTPAPTITSFTPAGGAGVTQAVTIKGTYFTGATAVAFHGTVQSAFTVTSDTQITTTVPAGATTGAITVTTPGGTATSASFTVLPGPGITDFVPAIGAGVSMTVTIDGANFTGTSAVAFNGTSATFTVNTDGTQITTTVPAGATTGPISVTTIAGSATSASFTVWPTPTISGYTPAGGAGVGLPVTILGTAFHGATAVAFNGVAQTTFTPSSDGTSIATTVPAAATTGVITVTTPGGVATSTIFTVVPTPTISSVLPDGSQAFPGVAVGTLVTIVGTGLGGATAVAFNGTAQTSFTPSDTTIATSVPVGATTGPVTVTTPGGIATSGTFVVTGAPVKLAFVVQPTDVQSGKAISPAVVVAIEDAAGNVVAGATDTISLTLSGAGTLANASATAVAGFATFTGLSPTGPVGPKALSAFGGGYTQASSASFNVTPGDATRLVFTQQPTDTNSAATMAPVSVAVEDASGNVVSNSTATIALKLQVGTAINIVDGTQTIQAADHGVATFSTLAITAVAGFNGLIATSGNLTSARSETFVISPGDATSLVFTQPPQGTASGSAFIPAVVVSAQDSAGNVATSFTDMVNISIETGNGSLTNSLQQAVAGVATFANMTITGSVGSGYTLIAVQQNGPLISAASAPFSVSTGSASKIVFSTEPPGSVPAGATLSSPVVVSFEDNGNNLVLSSGLVTLSVASGPCTLTNPTVVAGSGLATFSSFSVAAASGSACTLTASTPDTVHVGQFLTATSTSFSITVGPAYQLFFSTQPPASAHSTDTFAVGVTVQDAGGNKVATATNSVSLSIVNPVGGAALIGTTTVAAVAGVASFSGLGIYVAGAGYNLNAGAAGLQPGQSSAIAITFGVANKLAFTAQPPSPIVSSIGFTADVSVEDVHGNVVTSSVLPVGLTFGTNAGPGGSLSGTASVNAVAGVAHFANLSVDKVGTGYTLVANNAALGTAGNALSSAFNVTVGAATRLAFITQPSPTTATASASAFTVAVAVQDVGGNTVSSSNASITLAFFTNPGGLGTLFGAGGAVTATSGIATFSNVSIDKAATGYVLSATAPNLTLGKSAAFDIKPGAEAKLVFTAPLMPSTVVAGASFTPYVSVQDLQGNTVTTSNETITIALGTNPGSVGTLTGTKTASTTSGVASFPGLSINKVNNVSIGSYTLAATLGALTPATSAAFDVTPNDPNGLSFATLPPTVFSKAVIGPAIVTVVDAYGNVVTGSNASISMTYAGTGGGVLSGTPSVSAQLGVATFQDLSVDKVGTGNLTAHTPNPAGGEFTAPSNSFTIKSGTAVGIKFTNSVPNVVSTKQFSPVVSVTLVDSAGNTATDSTATVTVAIASSPVIGAKLSGTLSVAAVAGVAGFATTSSTTGISIDKAGSGYTLIASSPNPNNPPGVNPLTATSSAFNVSADVPAALVVGAISPANPAAGQLFSTSVTVVDASGNTATSSSGTVSLAFGLNPGAGTLSGTTSVVVVSGVANYSGLSINKTGTGYTLVASGVAPAGSTPYSSAGFNITVGLTTSLIFTTLVTTPPPASVSIVSGASFAATVSVKDGSGNVDTTFNSLVTMTLGNPGLAKLNGGATVTATATAGVATFSGLSIDKVGINYTLNVTATNVTSGQSNPITVTPGVATQLTFRTPPSGVVSKVGFAPKVSILDANGNTVSTSGAAVTMAFGINTAGGVLAGATGTTVVYATSTGASGGTATGVADFAFDNLNIDKASNYTIVASTPNPAGGAALTVTSSVFTVSAATPALLTFTTPPPATVISKVGFAPKVTIQDASGNTCTSVGVAVTIAFNANTVGGKLTGATGSTTLYATNTGAVGGTATGIADFSLDNLNIDKAATTYTLIATIASPSLSSAAAAITVTPAAASQVVITQQPSASGTSLVALTTALIATVEDASGNGVTTGPVVTLALGTNPGGAGKLSGTTSVAASSAGVATFSNILIDIAAVGYTLVASSGGINSVASSTITIGAAAASKLVFSTPPTSTTGGALFTPVVAVQDASGNTVTTGTASTASITLAIGTNPGAGSLTGTTGIAAVAGYATFTNASIDKMGTGYTLVASSSPLVAATSSPFNITLGAAARVAFFVNPSSTTPTAAISPAVVAHIVDPGGNFVSTSTATVTVGLEANPSGAALSGTLAVAAVGGAATFSNLSLNLLGNSYTLHASSPNLITGVSGRFNISICTGGAAAGDKFNENMEGCVGTQTYANRAALCGATAHVCSADEYVGNAAVAPTHNYWTNDDLSYSSNPNACNGSCGPKSCFATAGGRGFQGSDYASACDGSSTAGGDTRPMRVCAGNSDAEGNACDWTGCGFSAVNGTSNPNSMYFGGCSGDPTAGTLCCAGTTKAWFVNASMLVDTNAGTTASAAFKTIKKAMTMATAGQVVYVAPGAYNTANGETFPITVPAGVILIGDEYHSGSTTSILGAVVLNANSTLAGFAVTTAAAGNVVTISGANTTVRNNTLSSGNLGYGIQMTGGSYSITMNKIVSNTWGMDNSGATSGTIESNQVTGNGFGIVDYSAIGDLGSATAGGSAGNNIMSCNTTLDFWQGYTGAVSMQRNAWDHWSGTAPNESTVTYGGSTGVDLYYSPSAPVPSTAGGRQNATNCP